eukprot:GDKH01005505.1.p1 GENE.GDKH01005505.1~~GDKH01005505.1.p1  ORF type:complete len:82 (-),score=13.58 GDKH01005505.1:18-263(-)
MDGNVPRRGSLKGQLLLLIGCFFLSTFALISIHYEHFTIMMKTIKNEKKTSLSSLSSCSILLFVVSQDDDDAKTKGDDVCD